MTTEDVLLVEIREMRKEQHDHAVKVVERLARVETLTERMTAVEKDVKALNGYKNKIAGAYAAGALLLGFLGSVLKQRLFGVHV